MKRILGLDLGTTSIGWALVNEAENSEEHSSITRLGVRIVPLTVDEQTNFEKGKSITTNADRTLKRGMRRSLQRYKLRRLLLITCLKEAGIIQDDTILTENGPRTTFATLRARAKAATEEVSLEELARILLMINKKRGYKSSRKAQSTEEGTLIDGIEVAKKLHDEGLTPGQYVYSLLQDGKKYIPDFYHSDLQAEFDAVWNFQKAFHPNVLTDDFHQQLQGKSKTKTSSIFLAKYGIYTADNKGGDRRLQQYRWRTEALNRVLSQEELAYVIADINGAITGSSGYLGAISDRSKELYFNRQTIGQYILQHIEADPHYSLKNQTFYRQDYLDEFERVWEVQAQFHPELTTALKKTIRDLIVFYQRPLKSKKAMLDVCTFENRQIEVTEEGKTRMKTVGLKVCPKSSPLFQEFKVWQVLNNLQVEYEAPGEDLFAETEQRRLLSLEEMNRLAHELLYKDKLTKREALTILFGKAAKRYDLNYKEIEGNRTIAALYRAYFKIIALSGHEEYDISKLTAHDIEEISSNIFSLLGINQDILHFDASLEGHTFDQQPLYQLWHLLYSYEGDNSKTGDEALIAKLQSLCHCDREFARVLANVTFQEDYGSLSSKAMRKILPHLKKGHIYDKACEEAGYKHSERSRTKEELANREYLSRLELLPRNALRNPVVEKILNQMINVVNAVCDAYGKPDEIRIELARDLKQSAKEREKTTADINEANLLNEKYRKTLETEFGIPHVSRNDIIRYKLYMELKDNGFKTLYSDTYIPKDRLFSKDFDIEHIIPQARLFDDSFSNKTLEARDINIEKGSATAFDYIHGKWGEERAASYKAKIDDLYRKGVISKSKHDKLMMRETDIPDGFIDRDLRNSQYIAKKAREILEDLVSVVVPTIGSITDRLREDWQLVDVMQELNWDKYDCLGLTESYQDKDGRTIQRIKDWTKRNDHRHHAMDALTIAFTKPAYIQYLNNLSARSDKSSSIYGIEQRYLYRDSRGKLRFRAPIPLDQFRMEAKRQLEDILISIKAKNKVMTQNVNKTKSKDGTKRKVQLTPRGQLHNETIYGHTLHRVSEEVKVDGKMTPERAALIAKKMYREAVIARLAQFGDDPKKAFTGKNSPEKNPIWLNEEHAEQVPPRVKLVYYEDYYPIRKPVSPDLKLDKVIDVGIRRILQARLEEFGGDAKKAFSNLDENPIYLNKAKGITIKSVRIRGVLSAIPLHEAKDHLGHVITDSEGHRRPVDYVQTASTHHIAVYRDADGNLQDVAVSFLEATTRKALGQPVVDTDYNTSLGWKFLFSMKQNEYFIFPDIEHGFDPKAIDLFDPKNKAEISKRLYRVQKLSRVNYGKQVVREYVFRHHLETTILETKELKNVTFKNIKSLQYLESVIKVRVNHLGDILPAKEN
ncbi:MAG: type II CRISPR RNA-guided endonuclease Cas9 [Bacteroidaceae bacterium]|nr:type II CRISPR RNA-guided endonuclease Cas9 [Bacteroidaceae bacterium]